jgi:hypothetical protein
MMQALFNALGSRGTLGGCGAMVVAAVVAMGGHGTALAQHAGDVILEADAVRVLTRTADGVSTAPGRVFSATLGDLGPSFPDRTSNPGFNAIGGLPPGQIVTLQLTRALRLWNGTDFCTLATGPMRVRKSGIDAFTPATDPAPAGSVAATLEVGITGSDGAVHEHAAFWLQAPAATGVYLLELSVGVNGLLPSEPIWVLFNQNVAATELSSARAWALSNITQPDPLVCPPCRADFDRDGVVAVPDIFAFLEAWFAGDPRSDLDSDGINVQDIFTFLATWFAGC